MRRLLVLVAAVLGTCATAPAQAHGGSYDMKYVDGSNVLLLTFNTHAPVSGLEVEHDLRLYDLLGAPIPYDEVAIALHARDKQETSTLRGTSLVREETAPMLPTNESKLSFAYPVRGAYSLEVTFRAGGRDISHGEFAIDVGQGTSGPGGFPWIRLALVLLLGVVVGMALPRRTRSEREAALAGSAPRAEHPDGAPSGVPDGDRERVGA